MRLLTVEKPRRIIVLSRGEHAQESMRRDLAPFDEPYPNNRMRYLIRCVRNKSELEMAFRGVDTVIHAAALKIVPTCEHDPFEAVETNVLGSKNVINAALSQKVSRVVAISTDKACSPSTTYGGTKFCAERMFTNAKVYAGDQDIRFSVVRYGNVSGSQGSVIPFWRSILARGETKLPVTNPFCTRYWLPMDDAVELVMWTISNMTGGEIVVPEMPAYQVSTLAEAMGGTPEVIGMRVGEKLHEDMISPHEYRMFGRWGPYWVSGADGEALTGPMSSDTARRMGAFELGQALNLMTPLREAA